MRGRREDIRLLCHKLEIIGFLSKHELKVVDFDQALVSNSGMKKTLLVTVFLSLLVSCASSKPDQEDRRPSSDLSSLPLAAPAIPKLYKGPFEINPDGFSRKTAKVFLPLQYDSQEKWPLVILLHGLGGTAAIEDAYLALSIRTSVQGFILLTPQGTKMPKGTTAPGGWDLSDKPFWNATDFCCDAGGTGVDDVGYLTRLINEVKDRYKVDPTKVYLFGHSNGGFMANRLACEIGNEIAGIANLAGGSFKNVKDCQRPTPMAYLQIHAQDDNTIEYQGAAAYSGGVESVKQWVDRNGCGKPKTSRHGRDFLFLLPGNDTSEQNWRNCQSNKETALWTIRSVDKETEGHNPHIPYFNCAFTDAVLDFLFRQSRTAIK